MIRAYRSEKKSNKGKCRGVVRFAAAFQPRRTPTVSTKIHCFGPLLAGPKAPTSAKKCPSLSGGKPSFYLIAVHLPPIYAAYLIGKFKYIRNVVERS
jgi:hypothetical protein